MKDQWILFAVILLFPAIACADGAPVEPYSGKPTAEEMRFVRGWGNFLLKRGDADAGRYSADVPFSFLCGERSSREWVKIADAQTTSSDWKDGTRKHVLIWKDTQTRLVCQMELSEFSAFPAMEWVVRLRNDGRGDSANVHDFKALDIAWNSPKGVMPLLHRSVGGPSIEQDFQFQTEVMHASLWRKNRRIRMDSKSNAEWMNALGDACIPSDQRPSSVWLPMFNYQTAGDGVIAALGWNGTWFADFHHAGEGKSRIAAGMENLNAKLRPGESIRSPLSMVMYWQGELMHAQNMFRRFVLAHHTPRQDGRIISPPISCQTWGGWGEQRHLETIAKIREKQIPFDVYWIDAGWYGTGKIQSNTVFEGDWGTMAGDWRVNKNWYPNKFGPISAAANDAGMRFLIWVEPERAIYGRPITLEHPEFFLPRKKAYRDGETLLLNLADPRAAKWAFDTVSGLIDENHVQWYREDFNLVPNGYWNGADEPDRTGMTEMRFVENLYKFWDALLEQYPSLAIDNCASGGRRIELEALSRSLVLWRTDYNCFVEATEECTQDHSYGIAHWLPLQGIRPFRRLVDTYEARSALSPCEEFDPGVLDKSDEHWALLKKTVSDAQRAKRYFLGDFYPLTNAYGALDSWSAYHLYLPEEREGMILAIRRPKSDVAAMTFDLVTIDPAKSWTFEDADSGEIRTRSGKAIREDGYEVVIPKRRDSRLIFYKAVK